MEFRVLGPVELTVGDAVLALPSLVQRRLLGALLASPNVVVSTIRLIDILWGDQPPRTALPTLRSHMSRLRQALRVAGADALETRSPGYVLRVAPGGRDADRFSELVSRAAAVAARRPVEAFGWLEEALGLWRGPAFGEFAEEEFARVEGVRLHELRLVAMEDRAGLALALGRHGPLVGELQAQVATHPLRERPREQLMLALYRCGRQADALEAYQRYRATLDEELGLQPAAELVRLQAGILRHDPGLDWRAPVPGNLPVRVTSFVGLDGETATIAAALRHGPVLTLTGVGGVGKTSLAVQAAVTVGEVFPDGVWFCELATVRDPGAIARAVAGVLGVRTSAGSIDDRVVEFLVGKRLLLVVGNVNPIWPHCDGLKWPHLRAC